MLHIRTVAPSPFLAFAALTLALAPAHGGHAAPCQESGKVFEKVVSVLERWYFDKEFRASKLPDLADELRERAHAAASPAEERAVVNELLAQIPSSHLALISEEAYRAIGAELFGKLTPSFGLQLIELEGRYHATWVFEGGPAARAGVLRGDEVLSIDGLPPAKSPHLDWSTDDAALPDAAIHALLAEEGDRIELKLLRKAGESLGVELEAVMYSGSLAAEASVRIIEAEGRKFGYVHFWYIQLDTPSALLEKLFKGEFAACDGLILDLRGRGGTALEVARILKLLHPEEGQWRRPLVALTHRGTRSAKEVIAHRIQSEGIGSIVGERTAGAVIPAAFKEVGGGAVLMFPSMSMGQKTELLEGKGVSPDVEAVDRLPYTAGADPILEAGVKVLGERCAAVVRKSKY